MRRYVAAAFEAYSETGRPVMAPMFFTSDTIRSVERERLRPIHVWGEITCCTNLLSMLSYFFVHLERDLSSRLSQGEYCHNVFTLEALSGGRYYS